MTPIEIVRRKVDFDFSAAPVARWSDMPLEYESALNVLSHFFPAGEAFFITSVRAYFDEIRDPALKAAAEHFIFQEGMHSRAHARCNHALDAVSPAGERVSKGVATLLAVVRKLTPCSVQLAVTCALEHFTAMFADALLRNQDTVFVNFDPAFARLWLWHAAEETEHKGVCFDVYRHCVGDSLLAYLVRTGAMVCATVILLIALAVALSQIRVRASAPAGRSRLGMMLGWLPLRAYLDYYGRSFHPWSHDNRALVAQWRAKNPDASFA